MARQISGGRKTAFYVGTGFMVLGGLLFASAFVVAALNFGNPSVSVGKAFALCGICGMGFLMLGVFVRSIGARGLAGSGAVLDPRRARDELEPYSRMAGGMVKDALDEADVHLGGSAERVIMIKCTSCGTLNEDGSKFCQECGKNLGPVDGE